MHSRILTSIARTVERLPRSRHRDPIPYHCTQRDCAHGCTCEIEARAYARVVAPAVLVTIDSTGNRTEEVIR